MLLIKSIHQIELTFSFLEHFHQFEDQNRLDHALQIYIFYFFSLIKSTNQIEPTRIGEGTN